MSTAPTLVRTLLVVALTGAGAGCGTAYADPGGAPSGSASTRPAYVPLLDQPPPPDEKSPTPSKSEWSAAPIAPEVRVTDPNCTAKRLREWYRIECHATHATLVSGTREGLAFGRSDDTYTAWMVLPVRRGDRRLLLMTRRAKWGFSSDAVVSEQWLEGDPAPLIAVIGIPD